MLCEVNNMRNIYVQLYVLLLSQAAETLDHLTDLGQNVTINCDLNAREVYWILQKQSDSPTVILQSFSDSPLAFHFNNTLKNKYSVQSKHRLVINNVTVDELGVYYCMNTGKPPKLSNSTRLNIIETTENCEKENWTHWKTFTVISGLLNGFVIITVVGLIIVYVIKNGCGTKSEKCSGQRHITDLQQTQVTEEPEDQVQYVAVDFSKMRKYVRPSQDNSTYAALKLPRQKAKENE